MRPSPEQARVLDAVLPVVPVAAGAGAGKTTVLVERIWRDVEDEGIPVEAILVVTFNRAAAAHLRTRLQQRFADAAGGRPAHRAGLDLSAAWIGTFHALSARIVRMHPFAAGVDPGFTELDELEAAALAEQAMDEALAATTHPGLVDALSQATRDDDVRTAVRSAYARLRAAGDERPRITVPPVSAPPPGAEARLRALVDELDDPKKISSRHTKGIAGVRAMLAGDGPLPACPRIDRRAKRESVPLIEAVNELAADIWSARMAVVTRPHLEAMAELCERFDDAYTARKAERGALDYEDLQFHALRVLHGGVDLGVRRAYVDEFQDANGIQDALVSAFGAERSWVVGDGAQAIYGFRHATSAHFMERIGADPEFRLRDNHRSQPALMKALNAVFAHVLAHEPAFAPLVSAAEVADVPSMAELPVELVSVVGEGGEAPTRDQEARVVADRVAGLLARGYAHRDVAVLFRSLTEVAPYERALRERGIPVHLVAGRGFFSHQQVADVLALLHVVDNPHSEDHLVRVLASPHVGASDRELLELRRTAGRRQPLWPSVAWIPGAAGVVDLVAALRPVLRERGLAALVEAAICAADYDLAVLGLEEGRRRFANLRRLVRMAEAFAEVRGPDLPGFLAAVAEQERLGQDPGEAVLVDPDLDAVRLATVHAVKGQEFPAVVVADGSHGVPAASGMLVVGRDGAAGLRTHLAGGTSADLFGAAALRKTLAAEAAAEERRILYVALTRAERHVVVVGRPKGRGGEDCLYGLVRGAVDAGAAGVAHESVTVAPVPPVDRRPAPVAPTTAPVDPPPTPAAVAADPLAGRRLSFSRLSLLAQCPRRFHLEVERGLRGRREDRVPDPDMVGVGGGGALVGSLVHAQLDRHVWLPGAPSSGDADVSAPGWAAALADSWGRADLLEPEHAARAEAILRDVLAGDLARRIAGASRVDTESGFTLLLGGALLTGTADLHAVLPDGTHLLVDWKTHLLGDRRPVDVMPDYVLQRALYGLAALRAGAPRAELAWVFTDALDDPQTRHVVPADIPVLEAEVRDALAGLAAPERPPGFTRLMPHCSGCPGLRGSCPVGAGFTPIETGG